MFTWAFKRARACSRETGLTLILVLKTISTESLTERTSLNVAQNKFPCSRCSPKISMSPSCKKQPFFSYHYIPYLVCKSHQPVSRMLSNSTLLSWRISLLPTFLSDCVWPQLYKFHSSFSTFLQIALLLERNPSDILATYISFWTKVELSFWVNISSRHMYVVSRTWRFYKSEIFFDKNKADHEIPHCIPSSARPTVYQHVVIFGYSTRSPRLHKH